MTVNPNARALNPELSLTDILGVLLRHWRWVLFIPVATSLAVFLYARTLPKRFAYQGVLEVGHVARESAAELDNGDPLIRALIRVPVASTEEAAQFVEASLLGQNDSPSRRATLTKAVPISGTTTMIRLYTEGDSLDSAKGELETVVALLQSKYNLVHQGVRTRREIELKLIGEEAAATTQALADLEATRNKPKTDAIGFILLRESLQRERTKQFSIKSRLRELMAAENNMQTRLLHSSPTSASPIYPRTRLMVVSAFVLSLLLGIALAFLLESPAWALLRETRRVAATN